MEKKLYWFKFKDDFFDNIKIKKLRKIAGGDTYTIIYLKLQLLSLKTGGFLHFEGVEEDFARELSLKIDEDDDDVEITINFLLKHGMLIETEADKYVLPETIKCIGSESSSAERVRKCRERQKNLLLQEENNSDLSENNQSKSDECYKNVTCNKNVTLDNKIEDNKIEDNKINNTSAYTEIIDYLNEKTNSNFRVSTKKTQTLINSRLREGYQISDFKTVIEKKTEEWKNTEMEKYLVPETLFGNKFEKYLQQKVPKKKIPNWYQDYRKEEETKIKVCEENIDELNDFFKKGE